MADDMPHNKMSDGSAAGLCRRQKVYGERALIRNLNANLVLTQ